MVVQSQSSFDRFPKQARGLRKKIRQRVAEYDAVAPSPALAVHGESPEIDQFFLGDTNGCPFRLLDPHDVSSQRTQEESLISQ